MAKFKLTTRVKAPAEKVFALFSDFSNVAGRIAGITKVEVLTAGPIGVGTRFRETRMMFMKKVAEEGDKAAAPNASGIPAGAPGR